VHYATRPIPIRGRIAFIEVLHGGSHHDDNRTRSAHRQRAADIRQRDPQGAKGLQPFDGVTHRPTSRSAGNGKATVTLTTPAADTAVTGGGRPAEHRDRPQGVEVRVHGIGDHSTFSALGRPKYKELVDSRVWIGQVADEFTDSIPDGRGSGNKQALLAALNLCAWTAPQPHTTCTTTGVELLLAYLKDQDSSLDTATSSDVERALVVSSQQLLTVTPIFCQKPGPTLFACSTFGAVPIGCQRW
jgi:hypothetical protein